MNGSWGKVIITKISAAVYVAPKSGRHIHKKRPFHGFVLNDPYVVRNYCFDDGSILHTNGNSLFYLPKGSSYHVETIRDGACYAINFDSEISDDPFSVTVRQPEVILHNFKAAADAWKSLNSMRETIAMRTLYDAVIVAHKEFGKQYVSKTHRTVIAPAVEVIDHSFASKDLNIPYLASLCNVSEVYFRRLFLNTFGVSPKDYIIHKRIEYAKTLLSSGDFSVSEVAVLCGYTEPCHFSREFSKRVGISPVQYIVPI